MKNFFYSLIFFCLITVTAFSQTNVSFGANALNILGTENTAIGIYSLTSSSSSGNVAVGSYILTSTVGKNNSALGSKTLTNNTLGEYNVAMGYSALNSNTTGLDNCAIGGYSLSGNTLGYYNTALGYGAMQGNTEGNENIAIGRQTLYLNVGSFNNAIGNHALYRSTGSNNNAFGYYALDSMTTGYDNIAIGYKAGTNITTGFRNIIFGTNTSFTTPSSYNIAIGYKVGCAGDNNIIIGKRISIATGTNNAMNIGDVLFGKDFKSSESVSSGPANGKIGINVIIPTATLDVAGDAKISTNLTINGNMGIGTTTPRVNLEVFGNNTTPKMALRFTGADQFAKSYIQSDTEGHYLELGTFGTSYTGPLFGLSLAGSTSLIMAPKTTGSGFIGTTTAAPLIFGTNNIERVRFDVAGNVGIGTTTPSTKAEVYGTLTVDASGQSLNYYSEGIRLGAASNGYSNVSFGANPTVANGVQANQWWVGKDGRDNGFNIYGNSPNDAFHILPSGNVGIGTITPQYKLDVAGNLHLNIQGGSTPIDAMSIDVQTFGTGENEKQSNYFRVRDIGGGNYTPFIIRGDGFVGIGTSNPDAMLTVNGTIHAKEVNITVDVPADYVFKSNYKLMPLNQVEEYVNTNSHLPEIPSAGEISKNGMSVGEMQNKLLQKVEELTLYVIEQQKEINQLKQELKK